MRIHFGTSKGSCLALSVSFLVLGLVMIFVNFSIVIPCFVEHCVA